MGLPHTEDWDIMPESLIDFLQNLSSKPFIIQFVLSLHLENADDVVTQIKSFLILASTEKGARETANGMIDSLSEQYKSSAGKIVTVKCEGVYSVDELELVDSDGQLELANFQFSTYTRPNHLIHNARRNDLPMLD